MTSDSGTSLAVPGACCILLLRNDNTLIGKHPGKHLHESVLQQNGTNGWLISDIVLSRRAPMITDQIR